ncbi:hypothetical protein CKSOR_00445 [Candidatus Kinetoplastibacterium sorsogonicusi]|uniref:Uncharacterized protein n=1 Tax=Candidatus Kinetoplastidibacterium kentomonadis TaxID=1576550 RepID=A0A3S7JA55_9PROT|nr:hypothetical protein CKSOR_00445 [Candidatus Kinetoplastibacterium sorsogonicusi]
MIVISFQKIVNMLKTLNIYYMKINDFKIILILLKMLHHKNDLINNAKKMYYLYYEIVTK